jgi:hypothetical protein
MNDAYAYEMQVLIASLTPRVLQNIKMKYMKHTSETHEHTVAKGLLTQSLMSARSSMPRRVALVWLRGTGLGSGRSMRMTESSIFGVGN